MKFSLLDDENEGLNFVLCNVTIHIKLSSVIQVLWMGQQLPVIFVHVF